ncbi:MAG: flagellar hook-associated protein 3 [Desulfobacterales bacterium]|nr:flagellar hook-associated protein 3 [Desulfobacterales bacterium]
MRIATNTVYRKTDSNLGKLTSDSMDATNVVTNGKRINTISDDPVGLSQVMNLNSSVSNIDQLQRNISIARTWLNGGETTLTSIKKLIDDAKVLCIAIKNGSLSEADRAGAADQISGYIWQIQELSNAKVNGDYIFGGSKTSIPPFEFDNYEHPTKANYLGDEQPFSIKNGKGISIRVGHDGHEVFTNDLIRIDSTNCFIDFVESVEAGFNGTELTTRIPYGEYAPKKLAAMIEAALEARSRQSNKSEILMIDNIDAHVNVTHYDSLTQGTPQPIGSDPLQFTFDGREWRLGERLYPKPIILHQHSGEDGIELDFSGNGKTDVSINFRRPMEAGDDISFEIIVAKEGKNAGNSINYEVNYNIHSKSFSIQEDNSAPRLKDLQILWKSGTHAAKSVGVDIGFNPVDIKRNIYSDVPVGWPITISTGLAPKIEEDAINEILEPKSFTDNYDFSLEDLPTNALEDYTVGAIDDYGNLVPKNDEIIFTEDNGFGHTVPLIAKLTPSMNYEDSHISHQDLAADIQNQMRKVSYENGYGIDYIVTYNEDDGRFVIEPDVKGELKELNIDWDASTAATDLGFEKETRIFRKPLGADNVEWGVYRTLIDLRDYLKADDTDGIDRSMTRLESDFEHIISAVSGIGNNELRLDIKDNIIEDLNVSYRKNRSNIEDADAFEAISNFQAKEGAYKAALEASSRLMKVSLVDYIR